MCLLQIALQAYQMLERLYRQSVAADAAPSEQRMTVESLLRQFRVYGLICRQQPIGRVVYATRLVAGSGKSSSSWAFPPPRSSCPKSCPIIPLAKRIPPAGVALTTRVRNIGLERWPVACRAGRAVGLPDGIRRRNTSRGKGMWALRRRWCWRAAASVWP